MSLHQIPFFLSTISLKNQFHTKGCNFAYLASSTLVAMSARDNERNVLLRRRSLWLVSDVKARWARPRLPSCVVKEKRKKKKKIRITTKVSKGKRRNN